MDKFSQNLQLDRPRLLLPEGGELRRGIFYTALLVLANLGAWGCFITAFRLPVWEAFLAVMGLGFCGFSVWRMLDGRKRWRVVSLAGWVVWLVLLVFLFDQAIHGAVRVVNMMLDAYGSKLNYDLPVLSLPYLPNQPRPVPAKECSVFLLFLFYPFSWALGRMLVRRRNSLGPFALTGLLLLLPMSFSILPAGWAFAALLLFWSALLLIAPILGGREGLRSQKRRYRASGSASARPGTLLLLPAVLLCMAAIYLYIPPAEYTRPPLVDGLRASLQDGFGSASYLRGGQGNSNKQVDLNAMGGRSYTGETMLRVKFDWDAPVWEDSSVNRVKEYLHSFVGSVYTGKSWERLDLDDRQQLEALDFSPQNLNALYREIMPVSFIDSPASYTLSVENLGANPRCVYIPTTLESSEEELADQEIEMVDGSYAKSGSLLSGTKTYSLSGVGYRYPGEGSSSYFDRVSAYASLLEYEPRQFVFLENYGDFTGTFEGAGGVLLDQRDYGSRSYTLSSVDDFPLWRNIVDSLWDQKDAGGEGWTEDLWTMPEGFTALFSQEAKDLLPQAEAYNRFVYDHYTQVPEELEEFLNFFREAYHLSSNWEEYNPATKVQAALFARQIAEVFQNYYKYSLNPPVPERGQDFVEFFLDQSHEGYCVHFATAAVLLLRSAGYPARYAEGYAVPSGQEGWVDVPDYNAHAWVEVYCGGLGWIPMEVTPTSADNPSAYYNAVMPENPEEHMATPLPEEERPTMPPRRTPGPLEEDELPNQTMAPRPTSLPVPGHNGGSGGQGQSGGGVPMWTLILCPGILCLAGLALLTGRQIRIRTRRRDFVQRDRNLAGLKAYACLLKLYEWEALCGQRQDPPEHWKALAEKARFGRDMLSREELDLLIADSEALQKKLRTQLPRFQRVKCWLAGWI